MEYALLSPPLAFVIIFLAHRVFFLERSFELPGDAPGKRSAIFAVKRPIFDTPSSGGKLRPDYRRFLELHFSFSDRGRGFAGGDDPFRPGALPGLVLLPLGAASVFGLIMEVLQ